MSREKQAVLLIHGIGEQSPMSTLRGFVDAVWTSHDAIHHRYAGYGIWSKPDNASGSFELRRLVTPQNIGGIQTDFFECYWAHLMEGTKYSHLLAWARLLLLRRPMNVPRQLRATYWMLVLTVAAIVAFATIALADSSTTSTAMQRWWPILAAALFAIGGVFLLKHVGDAARYLHIAPPNIERRHLIRKAGVALLKELHDPERGYSRIIVVGHSLGSVIGYDILTHAWVDYNRDHKDNSQAMNALNDLEELARGENSSIAAVQKAQRHYFEELKANGCHWRVTDFVTLGSPLAHAALLLANNLAGLRQKQVDREFPTCLPTLETLKRDNGEVKRFSFEIDNGTSPYRVPHHAAVFAPTQWTNLYFPCRSILWGDVVGGPLAGVMGENIRDVPVETRQRFGLFSHTLYWEHTSRGLNATHIDALREALDLTDSKASQA